MIFRYAPDAGYVHLIIALKHHYPRIPYGCYWLLPRSRRPLQIDNIASHAVLASFGQTAGHNLANLIRIADEIHRLHIGASTRHLTIAATGTLDKDINNFALGSFVKDKLLGVQQLLKAFKPFRFYRFWNLYFRCCRGCSWARAIFK